MMNEVDNTITAVCKWIQNNLEGTGDMEELMLLPEMTKALAELVSARAQAEYEN